MYSRGVSLGLCEFFSATASACEFFWWKFGVLIASPWDGYRLGALYEAGNFMMTTWLPFIWACINVLVVILSSFSIQGGL